MRGLLATRRFLVDTNIISHAIRPKRGSSPGLEHFFSIVDEERLYLSTVTIGEIEKGIRLVPKPAGSVLEQRLDQLCDRFDGRIVPIDLRVARTWGRIHAERELAGKKTPVVDTLIAATAMANDLVVATADADFIAFSNILTIYNPLTKSVFGA